VIEVAQLQPWKLDLKLAGGDLDVRGLGIDSRWTTDLAIGGTADAPRFTGRADLVRGDYEFAGRNFRLDRGVIRFRGESPPDPLLDIRAEAQVQGLDASVTVRAPGSSPKSPSPACRSCRRTSCCRGSCSAPRSPTCRRPRRCSSPRRSPRCSRAGQPRPDQRAAPRGRARPAAHPVPADVATGQKTAIAAGKYIGRKLFVEVITDGQGYSATRSNIR
jgi:translocation and assembly module TamB